MLGPYENTGCEIAQLYSLRWDIEVRFRDMKTSLKLEEFRVKTPQMAL